MRCLSGGTFIYDAASIKAAPQAQPENLDKWMTPVFIFSPALSLFMVLKLRV